MAEATEHELLGYSNPAPGRFVARCSCGWTSRPFSSAGLAGSAHDQHVAAAKPNKDAGRGSRPGIWA